MSHLVVHMHMCNDSASNTIFIMHNKTFRIITYALDHRKIQVSSVRPAILEELGAIIVEGYYSIFQGLMS